MKVLHVTPSYFPAKSYGGPIESTHKLCLALAAKGLEVKVLTTDSDGPSRLAESGKIVEYAPNLRVEYCPRTFGDDVSLPLLTKLYGAIGKADVVHLTAVYSFTTIPTLSIARLLGKPVVWSPRGSLKHYAGTTRGGAKSLWEKGAFGVSGRLTLHCTSELEAQATALRIRETTGREIETRVIPNGVDVVEKPKSAQSGKLRFLFLGRLDRIKGLEQLIDACKLLREKAVPFRLTIAGTGEALYVQNLRGAAAGLGGDIEFVGFADDAKKRELFANSDLLILPSHTENFGMAAAEALANGVAVVASKGTPWQGLDAHGCGKWVENTPESLANAIQAMASEDLVAAGAKGREWMRAEFSWPHVADSMIELYQHALRR